MKNPITITRSASKTGKIRMTFELEFPNEEGEAHARAMAFVARLLRVALPDRQQRVELLAQMEEAARAGKKRTVLSDRREP